MEKFFDPINDWNRPNFIPADQPFGQHVLIEPDFSQYGDFTVVEPNYKEGFELTTTNFDPVDFCAENRFTDLEKFSYPQKNYFKTKKEWWE